MIDEKTKRVSGSFRDPASEVYNVCGAIQRRINPCYFETYDMFMEMVYPELIKERLIIPHRVESRSPFRIVIVPERIPFISYPYEWSFSMLKEAALNTLRINEIALKHGMILRDATAYNMQYYRGKMTLIDTTSFKAYSGDTPWTAYTQFIRHFLNPLLWVKFYDPSMLRLSRIHIDGVPISLTSRMIPLRSKINPRILAHIESQAWAERHAKDTGKTPKMSPIILTSLLKSLYKLVNSLIYKPKGRGWLNYVDNGESYTYPGYASKRIFVGEILGQPDTVLDLGANTGEYSRAAVGKDNWVIAVDNDHDCVNHLYGAVGVLPLYIDVCNPSGGIGWSNNERYSFWDRIGQVDTILALAIIHHLSIRNNVPLSMVADLLADHCKRLIIEWIPPSDKQAIRLLAGKVVSEYSHAEFLRAFGRRFQKITEVGKVFESERIIYEMEVK